MNRLTIEYIKEQFEKEEYKLLSIGYGGAHSKLEYICPKGHRHVITWTYWQQGQRCPYCVGLGRPTIEFIKLEFENEGYTLLSKKYMNNSQKLRYICPRGHRHSIKWSHFKNGHGCPYCAGQGKPTIEFIRSEFEKEDYILISTKYSNCNQKLEYVCFNGHEHSITWDAWQQGKRCSYCAGNGKLITGFIRSEFGKEDYTLLTTEYENAHQKLDYICPNGHKHNISWSNWQQGQRCPYCVGHISKGETQVRNFVESLGIEVSANNRSQISNPETGYGLELDIFIPDLNKAIEYNGEYWHQNKNKDLLKQQLCKQNNIDLLTIWDSRWKEQPNLCENEIKTFVAGTKNF